MANPIIGVIGGMGPLATVDLFGKLVDYDAATTDQGHVRVLVDDNTNIQDRTGAILAGNDIPVKEITASAQLLEKAGAQVLIMGCNTAHFFYKQAAASVKIPFLSIIEETCREIRRRGFHTVGLMATVGTTNFKIYQNVMEEQGITCLVPSEEKLQAVHRFIYEGVKAGDFAYDTAGIQAAVTELCGKGAQALILGCTELPVAFDKYPLTSPVPLIDPTAELAKSALRFVGAKIKE